jgi:hypothetical protein
MQFVPLGQEEKDQPTQLEFVPLADETQKKAGQLEFVPIKEERAYQDVAVAPSTPEEMLTPSPKEPGKEAPVVQAKGFQAELLPEQFKSGVAGLQGGYYATASKNNAELLNMMDRIDRGEKVRPIDDVLGYADMDPETRKKTRDAIQSTMTGTVAKTIAYDAERKGYKRNENADLAVKLADQGELAKAYQVFAQDPVGIIQQLSVESTPNALPSLIAGSAGLLLRGGTGGLMAGLATGSFPVEYMASITDSLQEAGIDLKDAKAVEAKLRDPKFLEEAGKRAITRGTVIATADAASGKLLMPFKAGQLGKNAAKAMANVGTEAGVEMTGEAAAQAASGEEIKLGQVIAEGVGSLPQSTVGTALKTVAESVPTEKEVKTKEVETEKKAETEAKSEMATLYKDTVTRFMNQGFTLAEADRFATEELGESGYGRDEIDAGRSESGISVSDRAADTGRVTTTAAGTESGELGGVGKDVVATGEGTKVLDTALDPFRITLTDTYGADIANQIVARAKELVTDGATPDAAIKAAETEITEETEETGKAESFKGLKIEKKIDPTFGRENLIFTGYDTSAGIVPIDANTAAVTALQTTKKGTTAPGKFLLDMVDWADTNGQTLTAIAGASNKQETKRLVKLYEKLGFVPDAESQERIALGLSYNSLVRPPKTAAATETKTPKTNVISLIDKLEDKDDADLEKGILETEQQRGAAALTKEVNEQVKTALSLARQVISEGSTVEDRGPTFFPEDTTSAEEFVAAVNFVYEGLEKGTLPNAVTAIENLGKQANNLITTIESRFADRDSLEGKPKLTLVKTPETTTPATKGKKVSPGRPKVVLTPEQKQAKQEQRKLSQKASIDAGRTVDKAAKVLDEPFDIGAFPDETAAKDAQETRDAEVIEALTTAFQIANDPKFRKNKPGQKAQALIDRYPPESRVRQIAEARSKLGKPSPALTTTTNEHDPDMLKINDAQSLLGYIKTFGTAFEKILAARLRPLLKGVRVIHVADPDRDIVDDKARASFVDAIGMYFRKAIYLNANPDTSGENNETALHEALHGGTVAKIERYYTNPDSLTKPERDAMKLLEDVRYRAFKYYNELVERAKIDPRFQKANAAFLAKLEQLADPDGINVFGDLKEFVTYGMTQPDMQRLLFQAPGSVSAKNKRFANLFTEFVDAIRKLLSMGPEHMSALQDLIIVTDQLLGPDLQATTEPEPALAKNIKSIKKQQAKVDKDVQKVQLSNDAYTGVNGVGSMIANHGKAEDYIPLLVARTEAMDNKTISDLLYTFQTADIYRWEKEKFGDNLPGLVEVDRLQQDMASMKTRMLNAAAKQADKLNAFIRKNGMTVIANTMHLARLKKVSPTAFATLAEAEQKDPVVVHYEKILTDATYRQKLGLPTTLTVQQQGGYKAKQEQRRKDLKIVYDSWAQLGKQKNGHEMYIMVRQFYKDQYLAYRAILDDQIAKLPISDDAKEKLLKSVRLMQEQAKGAPDPDYDGMTLKQMPEEYFPFRRYGSYWLRVTKGPTGRELYFFESGTERNEFLFERAKKLGKDPKDGNEFVAGDNVRSLRDDFSTDSLMLQQMFEIIDGADADGRFDPSKYKTEADAKSAFDAYKEELKDQLYQTYLLTMPERSFRKQFLHSENITGFTTDIFRNFKESANAYANQLSRLKYAGDIRESIQRARDALEGMPPLVQAKRSLFIDAIESAANDEISPPPESKVVGRINQFVFLMLLTSAASAATQMASIPIMVMPTLKQRYGSLAAGKEFLRYITFFKTMGYTAKQPNGDVEFTAPSIGSSAMVRNNPILQRAFQAALDRHVTTLTNTSVLTNRNRTPDNSYQSIPGVAARTVFNIMTALFNGAERMSREIAFMMTFKLEYEKTKDFDKSVEVATESVYELLGRYDNFNRPRILQNAIGKTVGQFKMYSVFVTSWFARNGYTAFTEGMGNKEGRAAMERLIGVLVMGGLFHGIVGQPLYSVICSTIDAVLNAIEDEDDEERKARYAKDPLTAESSNLRFRYEFLPKYFGEILVPGIDGRDHRLSEILEKGPISVLTDINVGSRTSFDGIWFRDPKPGKTLVDTVGNFIVENLGPGVSMGSNMFKGVEDLYNGKIQRGLEGINPSLFKGSLVAYRLDTEGAETKRGDKLLQRSEINDLNLIAAVLGFQSSRIARQQEFNFAMVKEKMAADNSRGKALSAFNEAILNAEGEPEDIDKAINKIRDHNKRYPMEQYFITEDTMERSLEQYVEAKGLTFRGLRVPEKLIPYILPKARFAEAVSEAESKRIRSKDKE